MSNKRHEKLGDFDATKVRCAPCTALKPWIHAAHDLTGYH